MNIEFKSHFGADLKNMLHLMKAHGWAENTYMKRAAAFDHFCCNCYPECTELTEGLALSWIKDAKEKSPGAIHDRSNFLRGFAVYLNRIGKTSYVFPEKYFSSRSLFVPYIFTDEEMTKLFATIDAYQNNSNPFAPALLSTYYRLTYTCGLRPNEGRTLRCHDIHLDSGEIQIVCSKKGKSRIVVMSDDMLKLARRYDVLRESYKPDSEYFFPSPNGAPFSARWMQNCFQKFFCLANAHIQPDYMPRVRVYDLRHRFATAALNHWLDEKQDIQARLPYLQIYMGHSNATATAYYIHLLPENLVKSSGIDWASLGKIYPDEELWKE